VADGQSGSRDEAFGYVCRRCAKCCHNTLIQVDPYEIARLAGRFGQTTTEFRTSSTMDGAGVHLRQKENGACIFLGPEGCTVYSDRPLVCRVYPLGRHVDGEGKEHWIHVAPHPESLGEYSKEGTIGDYVAAQEIEPFTKATAAYTAWVGRAAAMIGSQQKEPEGDSKHDTSMKDAYHLIDMDAAIAGYCSSASIAPPTGIEARLELHLAILNRHLDELKGADDD